MFLFIAYCFDPHTRLGMVMGVALAEIIFNNIFAARSGGLTLKVYGAEMEPFFMAAFQSAMLAGCFAAGSGKQQLLI
jgi:hypothetical protein